MSTPKDTRTALGDITNNHVTGMLQIFDMYTTVQSNTSRNMLPISYMYCARRYHDCFNIAIRMAAQNKFLLMKNQKQKYHFMDLQFVVSSSNS